VSILDSSILSVAFSLRYFYNSVHDFVAVAPFPSRSVVSVLFVAVVLFRVRVVKKQKKKKKMAGPILYSYFWRVCVWDLVVVCWWTAMIGWGYTYPLVTFHFFTRWTCNPKILGRDTPADRSFKDGKKPAYRIHSGNKVRKL